MLEQIKAGFCQDITNAIAGDFKESFYPAGVQAFIAQGKSYGLPDNADPNVFWHNKDPCEKAGVDPNEIKYWEDLLDALKKCKAAGVTPMTVGGSEKWPLHFVAMDQFLGRETGRVFNDEALAVAAGAKSPEQATRSIENSWSQNRI